GVPRPPRGYPRRVQSSPEARPLWTPPPGGAVRLGPLPAGRLLRPPLPHPTSVSARAGGAGRSGAGQHPLVGSLTGVSVLSFSPDGRSFLTGVREVQRWETATGRPLGPPLRHPARILAATFSRDGQTIWTGSADRTGAPW